jgi:uncharacterized 2Fe-2S/4Fe-4S cluster protein (DUF4445 family)
MREAIKFNPARHGALSDYLFEEGVEFPCGGTTQCGGCKVRVVSGEVPVTADMRAVLSDAELAAGWRLACQAQAWGPVELEVAQWSASILTDESRVPFEPGEGFGAVVDIGTTTVVAQRVDLATGEVLAVVAELNEQARQGSDLMSRIEFDRKNPADLGRVIRGQVERMVAGFGPLRETLLVGNTVMHHLFSGLSVEPLAAVPFRSPNLGAQETELGVFLPCVGGFVGSDLLAGLVATGMNEAAERGALLDLGTNGEIAVGDRDGIVCASTAAGPAFEGGRISRGMRAGHGAIDRVEVRDGSLRCHVLGGGTARGLCGSGLVDAVAAALDLGLVQLSGRLRSPIELKDGVAVTQADIRELQLAKGAIAGGLRLLLGEERPGQVCLAGAFGNYIRAESARRIGLLPGWAAAPVAAGNTALRGARMLLLAPSRRNAILEELLGKTRHVELASDAQFQEAYVEAMGFSNGDQP